MGSPPKPSAHTSVDQPSPPKPSAHTSVDRRNKSAEQHIADSEAAHANAVPEKRDEQSDKAEAEQVSQPAVEDFPSFQTSEKHDPTWYCAHCSSTCTTQTCTSWCKKRWCKSES